jgi:hypothetical protein
MTIRHSIRRSESSRFLLASVEIILLPNLHTLRSENSISDRDVEIEVGKRVLAQKVPSLPTLSLSLKTSRLRTLKIFFIHFFQRLDGSGNPLLKVRERLFIVFENGNVGKPSDESESVADGVGGVLNLEY